MMLMPDTWDKCMFCGNDSLEGEEWEMEGSQVWQEVTCTECQGTWNEVYYQYERVVLSKPTLSFHDCPNCGGHERTNT